MNPFLQAAPWIAFPLLVPILLRRRPRLRDCPSATGELPRVSIILPARNEAINIGPCVGTLLATSYPNREIIIVDDGSTDGTGELARALAERAPHDVRVVQTQPLPPDWIGKSWACWTGFREARGELLLFTDADTRHEPTLLTRAVGALQHANASLLSLLPRQQLVTFWERLVLPQVFLGISMRYANAGRVNRTRNPRHVLANGQFLLLKRSTYERIDGHHAVRAEVVEDVALAQRTVSIGEPILLLHAAEFMQTRMYRSLREIVEGWSKNLALGARMAFPPRVGQLVPWLVIVLLLGLWLTPPVLLLGSFFYGALAPLRLWALTATTASLAGWIYVHLHMRSSLGPALLFPLGTLVTCFILGRSAWRGRRVEWRGRRYDVPAI
ncbi:MAG: glycosyltransferase [Longimicrobiales bacterium]